VLLQPDTALLTQLGADVVFPAFFLLLALEEIRSRRAAVAALCGACLAGGLLLVAQPGVALLGATAGALVGALPGRRQNREPINAAGSGAAR
jgi:predicted branched-subunit amino acid permease